METLRYSDILRRLEGLDPWLRSLGLTPRNNDRIHQALSVVRMADEATRKGHETGQYSRLQSEHLFPLVEAVEAHDIFCVFEKDSSGALASALRRGLSGPTQPIDEKNEASRDGRNVWFELALAAEWKLRGAAVELAEPDLNLFRDGATFLIACKRPGSESSVRSNIRGAIKQLNRSLQSAPNDVFGVIAISLSRILNPGTSYWTGDIEQLGNRLNQEMLASSQHWRSASTDPRTCAILFHAATPSDFDKSVDLSRMTYTVARAVNRVSDGTRIFEKHVREMKARA